MSTPPQQIIAAPDAGDELEEAAPGSRGRVTRAGWEAAAAAYRDRPGDHVSASAASGLPRTACERAWLRGWQHPDGRVWSRPLRDLVAEEQAAARALAAAKAPADDARTRAAAAQVLGDARSDLAQSRALQGRAIRNARTNSLAMQGIVARVMQGGGKLAERLQQMLAEGQLTIAQSMKVLKEIATMLREANVAMQIADEMERRALGEPDAVIAFSGAMTPAEAEAELAAAAELHIRRQRGPRLPPGVDPGRIIDVDEEIA